MSTDLAPLVLTDPTEAPTYGDGPISRWCKEHLHDARDEVFVRLSIRMTLLMSSMMIGLWAALHSSLPGWAQLLAALLYFAVWGWFVPPVILMLHCTMHRAFIKSPKWLNRVHPYAMSFFFGMPTGYAEHHLGMHHVEDNMGEDLSGTYSFRRDSFVHFISYWARFFFLIAIELPQYLNRHGRTVLARRAFWGEVIHQLFVLTMLLIDWRFALVTFALPMAIARSMMMVGNWGQHAFVNTERKNNGFSNSVTCINTVYNQRAFNDGYHIGHHLKANRHWTEAPKELLDNREQYIANGAIVFQGIDFFMVSVLLWSGQWKTLARCYVNLDGKQRSEAEIIALLKSRVHPLRPEEIEFMTSPAAAV